MRLVERADRHGTSAVDCGCCARTLPRDRVAELGNTPGVYICRRCAIWAIARSLRQ